MGWRRVEQGIETQTLEIQPATCPVCRKGLYRNITFLTGGWAPGPGCDQGGPYGCLSRGGFLKDGPPLSGGCRARRRGPPPTRPSPPPRPQERVPPCPP